jgi:hypothetical protein
MHYVLAFYSETIAGSVTRLVGQFLFVMRQIYLLGRGLTKWAGITALL